MKAKTDFDEYLDRQLVDPEFARHFEIAGEAWDVSIQLAALRKRSGLSQKELARRLGTSQQQVSRLESPAYEGHSLSMLRRVARALDAEIHVRVTPLPSGRRSAVAERRAKYRVKKKGKKT
jgi:transcriptional regulator with XRE-family HTH domain